MPLPYLIAGPMVRRATTQCWWLWALTSARPDGELWVRSASAEEALCYPVCDIAQSVQVGERAWVVLLAVAPPQPLVDGQTLSYDWRLQGQSVIPENLYYPGKTTPHFRYHHRLRNALHGSCRKPHAPGEDALAQADNLIHNAVTEDSEPPSVLLLTGDQVYADDVAGPMLHAIHQVCDVLGLWPEQWQGAEVNDSETLHRSAASYYRRESLLPQQETTLYRRFFAGGRKPIFTSVYAKNHLISLSEVVAMYALVWSSRLWSQIDLSEPAGLSAEEQQRYSAERQCLENFVSTLPAVERVFAHLPTYMIFDDHDVTDDWNLNRAWEEAAYGHPFSRRIIGNALLGYALFQGWGNDPQRITPLIDDGIRPRVTPAPDDCDVHDAMIDAVFHWHQWGYQVPVSPLVLVLDTRTQRWRSERKATKPSGLMDWEALTEAQQALVGKPAVLMVSPAPIFGVKFIEVVQRVFSWFGLALMVDAENWMAHKGAAQVMLNIFQHARTPTTFTILSGDVHYSFVYDVRIRHSKSSPHITQITASGIKNRFPERLIRQFDRLNHFLYGRGSPLNLLTKRKRMRIRSRHVPGNPLNELVNGHALGAVWFNEAGEPGAVLLHHPGGAVSRFERYPGNGTAA
ncbi:MAG: metallophosphoesterase family protein [Saccharospirillum sp.]